MKHELTIEAARAAPPVTVTGLSLFGVPLSDLVLILTGIYTAWLLVSSIIRFYHWWRHDRSSAILARPD